MHKHTPGPWRVYKEPMNPNPRIMAEANTLVVVVSKGRAFANETEPNAHLIAAAPELFEALDRLASEMAVNGVPQYVEDAIAKAEGRS